MANVIQLKRGAESARSGFTPAAGEPIYVTDENKLYVGDGSTAVQSLSALGGDLTMANGSNNRVMTATSSSAMNAEANLTFDGSTLAVTGDATVSDDLGLVSDSAKLTFGANSEVELVHVHNEGLILKHTATADDKPVSLVLQTGETDIAADDVIGKIGFQAPDEGTGTDAILMAAEIAAVSEGDFAADANATTLSFRTGSSAAAAERMTLSSAGVLDVDGGITVDNITIDGTEIDLSSGDLTLDVAGDIVLDAAGDEVIFKDGSTNVGHVSMASDNLTIKSLVSDKDMVFQGNDGGSGITALTFDMSAAGKATFNDEVVSGAVITSGAGLVVADGANIGSASDTDAIEIASNGVTTFSQAAVFSSGAGFGDSNITNVGDINCDKVSVDAASAGLDIDFSGANTAKSSLTIGDNLAEALVIQEGSNDYLQIVTTNSSEALKLGHGVSGTAITIGHSTSETTVADNLTVSGDLTVAGTTTTVAQIVGQVANAIVFEGASADAHETTLTITDPTADATFALPALSAGDYHLAALADSATDASAAVTAAEFALLDGATSASSVTVADGDRVIFNDGGTMKQVAMTDLAAYFDDEITAMPNLTSVGTLGALTVDDVGINGKVITMTGSSSDTATFTVGTNGTLDIVTTDDNAAAANIQITADGTAELAGTTVTLDSGADIVLDANGADILLKDDGTTFGEFTNSSTDFVIKSTTSNKDMIFKGNDGGSAITALTLDMSDAGRAVFNNDVRAGVDMEVLGDLIIGAGADEFTISESSDNITMAVTKSDKDLTITMNDGGSSINALVLDGSDAGAAAFNGVVTAAGFTIGSAVIGEAELEILDGASVTTAELNIMDGNTSATSTTLATADRMVMNDNGTMKQVALSDLVTFLEDGGTSNFNVDGGTYS